MKKLNNYKDGSIDVIIPVYNGEKFISEAINSVLSQTYLPSNLIIVNDGSTDNSVKIVEKLISAYKGSIKISLFNKENGGPSSARNLGIQKCSNEFIALLDADDVWDKKKLEMQIDCFNNSSDKKLGVVFCNYFLINENNEILCQNTEISAFLRGNIFFQLIKGNQVAGCDSAVLIKRECFDKVELFDMKMIYSEDWDIWLRISEFFNFDFVQQPLVKIRRHELNLSRDNEKLFFGNLKVYEKLLKRNSSLFNVVIIGISVSLSRLSLFQSLKVIYNIYYKNYIDIDFSFIQIIKIFILSCIVILYTKMFVLKKFLRTQILRVRLKFRKD